MLYNLSQFKDAFGSNPNVRFVEQIVDGVSFTIISYMVSDDELWKAPLGIETRGITFNTETGELVSLPFEKFFNVNEKEHTQSHIVEYWMRKDIPYIATKMDGSMITPVLVGDKVFLKTKKSFFSDVAILAQESMTTSVEALCRYFLTEGFTPIFEFTHPDNRVVVDYGDSAQFTLIAARNMNNGEYIGQEALDYHASTFGLKRPKWFICHDLNELTDKVDSHEGEEGWVIYVAGNRYKVKTKWYIDRHRLIDVRERDIAEYCLDETLDDLIPNLIAGGADMSAIRKIEHNVASALAHFAYEIDVLSERAREIPEGKERAEWVNSKAGELAGFVFRCALGNPLDETRLREWYRKKYIKDYSLRSVGNPNFTKVDDES